MNKTTDTLRRSYFLAPCPYYDVEGMESWLSDKAKEGLFLSKDGFFLGIATFERDTPQEIIYRLEASPEREGLLDGSTEKPTEEAIVLSKKYGWEYVTTRGEFHIYRTSDLTVRELNTDPEVQALSLKVVQKRLASAAKLTVFWALLYPAFFLFGELFLTMINLGSWIILLCGLLVLWSIASSIKKVIHLHQLRNKLRNGEGIDHKKNWEKKQIAHYVRNTIYIGLFVFLIGSCLYQQGRNISGENEIPLSEYNGTLPFATMRDFVPNGTYHPTLQDLKLNKVRSWSDTLSPVNYDWHETAMLVDTTGKTLRGGLSIDYHETISPWLAKALSWEYMRRDDAKKSDTFLDVSNPGVDYIIAYMSDIAMPTVIIRENNIIIHAYFYQTSDYQMSLDEWVAIIADSIK